MFFTYLWRELRRRMRQAIFIAIGLALGIGLVITVTAASAGVKLTMAAVTRRIREFGTLKALGWKGRRIVFQVMGEALAIGIVGGVVGVGLGFAGAGLVNKFSSPLTASLASNTTGSATPGGARNFGGGGFPGGGGGFPTGGTGGGNNPFRGAFSNAARGAGTVTEHLHAPVTIAAVAAAVALAILGGLIAGGFGGWRAARLRPAAALSKVA